MTQLSSSSRRGYGRPSQTPPAPTLLIPLELCAPRSSWYSVNRLLLQLCSGSAAFYCSKSNVFTGFRGVPPPPPQSGFCSCLPSDPISGSLLLQLAGLSHPGQPAVSQSFQEHACCPELFSWMNQEPSLHVLGFHLDIALLLSSLWPPLSHTDWPAPSLLLPTPPSRHWANI